MGYDCSAAVDLTINDVESQELDTELISNTLVFLRNNVVKLKKDYKNECFFSDIKFYHSFSNEGENTTIDHQLLTKIYLYKGEYNLESYLLDYDDYIQSPEDALQLLIFCFYLSKEIPTSKISLDLGDAGYFSLNLELLDGEITDINLEWNKEEDEEECWAFVCDELEIRHFFLSQNCLWMESNNVDSNEIERFYNQKMDELMEGF